MATTAGPGPSVVLDAAAQAFADAAATPPYLFELGPDQGRKVLDEVQSGPIVKPAAGIEDLRIPGGPHGDVALRIVRPAGVIRALPAILYLHGAGWVFGDPATHDRLVRELAVGVGAAVVFCDYRRAPEERYPSQIEECWAAAEWTVREGAHHALDPTRLAVCGDSVGGNLAIALTLLAKERVGPRFAAQALFYPVTDARGDTESYRRFAEGYHLRSDAMAWFWDQYTADPAQRDEITASPLRASTEQLAGLPPALVITAEADVLRDEGEAYARKLRAAGVPVVATRYQGTIHDFMLLDPLAGTGAARAAVAQAVEFLRTRLDGDLASP
jgi:acetyl esterase